MPKFFYILPLLCLVLGFSFVASARGQKGRILYLEEPTPLIEEARLFRFQAEGLDVVGADIGPEQGVPVVLVGGYTYSFPYLRKFIRALNDKGFRVFVYNPPGQGLGVLESGVGSSSDQLGIDGMLKILPAIRHHAFAATGGQQVVVIGHSLGGLQVRAGSLGIRFNQKGEAYFSKAAYIQSQRETALIVPMFSLPMIGDEMWSEAESKKVLFMKDMVPALTSCFQGLNCMLPNSIGQIQDRLIASYLKQVQGNLHRGLFGSRDLDENEIEAISRYLMPHKVSRQIREDMTRWVDSKSLSTSSGFDFGKLWFAVQTGSMAFETLYIAGEDDSLTEMKPFADEAKRLPSAKLKIVPSGHVGAFISQKLPDQLAKWIREHKKQIQVKSCGNILVL